MVRRAPAQKTNGAPPTPNQKPTFLHRLGASLSSQTGKVLVGADPSVGCIPALHFGFDETHTRPGEPTGPNGIRWTFRATAPKGGAGDLDATQLIERTDERTALPGPGPNPAPPIGTHGQSLLDQCLHYGNDQ